MHRELLTSTRRLVAECDCESGCPGCVGPVGNTGPMAKVAALRILDLLLEPAGEISATDIGDTEVQAF
jgi:DEAD/DEAH box helicase domain-containing protein